MNAMNAMNRVKKFLKSDKTVTLVWVIGIVIIWEICACVVAATKRTPVNVLPHLYDIIGSFFSDKLITGKMTMIELIASSCGETLLRAGYGFLIGTVLGYALALFMNLSKIVEKIAFPYGRTGKMFAFENFGVKPDIVSFAKGITCGYVQLGGVCVSKQIAAYFDDHLLSCGLTYSGHPLACAAGVACLEYYDEAHILDNVNASGKVLGELLEELKAKHACVGDVRYIGLFSSIELVKDKETREPLVPYGKDPEGIMGKIIGKLRAKGFMTYSHENMLFVSPPLIITPDQLREEMEKMNQVLTEVDQTM